MPLDMSQLIQIILLVFGVGSVYGLIRNDLKNLHERIAVIDKDIVRVDTSSLRAHERIDDHISTSHLRN